jgi:hypothetical protein
MFPEKEANEKEDLINSADEQFAESEWDKIENDVYQAVKRHTNKFETKESEILFSDENVALIASMTIIIAAAIQASFYPEKTKQYLSSFDDVYDINQVIHDKLNDISKKDFDNIIKPILLQNIQITTQNLTGTGLNTAFIEPLKQGIYKSIVSGAKIEDLDLYLQSFIISNNDRLGHLKKYSTVIARDALFQFDGQINSYLAVKYNFDSYRYVGGIIKDTRPQCVRWSRMGVLKKSDIQKEINWANNYGSGMIPGTTPETFPVYRGGYNCRHSAIPFKG